MRSTAPAFRLSPVQAAFRERLFGKLQDGTYELEDVPVCLCGSSQSENVAGSDRFGMPVGCVICTSCGLLRTTPRLAGRNLPSFYQLEYHGLHMGIEHPDPTTSLFRAGQGAAIYDFVAPHIGGPAILVAEVGAGTGSVLREFAAAAAADGIAVSAVGCEYADDFAAAGRSAGADIRTGGTAALSGMQPPDVLILSHVVEHFPDPMTELAAIRALLSERTVVYVEVPGVLTIHQKREYNLAFGHYLTLAHTYHFTLDTLRDLMARSGFRFVCGDEQVRSVFVVGQDTIPLDEGAGPRVARMRDYLAWLDSALSLRIRRRSFGGIRRLRRFARAAIRQVKGAGSRILAVGRSPRSDE